jgi:Tfp pilus assembly pilus retraction ATPase PilT
LEAVNIEFDDYFFVSSSVYNHYHNTKTINIGGEHESNISDILKYMEQNDVSDLHFQLLDEYSYYFTARFGQEVVRITEIPVSKAYVNQIYNQALLKIGKDNLSDPPEVSGLITERLVSKSGILKDRTFRFHSMFDNKGEFQGRAVSIRRLMNYEEISSMGLEGLNYNKRAIELIAKVSKLSHGTIFITGKTNSGKSTLLYCILSMIHNAGRRIKSIESPVEVISPFSQVDLTKTENAEEKYKMTRELAVSALLRQDPDVVLIQEVRTKPEVDEFIELGLKGHLAYSTMHTGSVQETIQRALKSVDNPKDLQQTLKLIITQELIRKKCPECNGEKIVEGSHCKTCNGLGSKGVLPLYEIAYIKDSEGDLTNLKSLVQLGQVEYISKKDVIKEYSDKGWVFDEDIERVIEHEKDLSH